MIHHIYIGVYIYIYMRICGWLVCFFNIHISIYLHIDTDPCGVMLYLFLFGFTCVLVHSFNICVFLKDPVCIPCGEYLYVYVSKFLQDISFNLGIHGCGKRPLRTLGM